MIASILGGVGVWLVCICHCGVGMLVIGGGGVYCNGLNCGIGCAMGNWFMAIMAGDGYSLNMAAVAELLAFSWLATILSLSGW